MSTTHLQEEEHDESATITVSSSSGQEEINNIMIKPIDENQQEQQEQQEEQDEIPSSFISPIHYTTELFCKQYTNLFIQSTNQKQDQQEQFTQIDNLIEILLKRCDEMGESLDSIHSNSIQINDDLLPNLLKMIIHLKQVYTKIDNLNLTVNNAKDKINLLDSKMNEFEKQKTSEKFKFVSNFFKFNQNSNGNENTIQFNKDDYLL